MPSNKHWSNEEMENIKKYSFLLKNEIQELLPSRSWVAIKAKAQKEKIPISRSNRIGDLTPLLNKSNVSFYWLGFLCADGHFNDTGCLSLELSNKDKKHLLAFSKYIAYPETSVYTRTRNIFNTVYESSTITVNHKEVVDKVKDTYGIRQQKTKNPVILTSLTDEQLLCWSIGFIDGDGSICFRKDNSIVISIEIDETWISILQQIEQLLTRLKINTTAKAKLYTRKDTKQTFSRWQTSSILSFTKIKEFALLHKLPIMDRKWNNKGEK